MSLYVCPCVCARVENSDALGRLALPGYLPSRHQRLAFRMGWAWKVGGQFTSAQHTPGQVQMPAQLAWKRADSSALGRCRPHLAITTLLSTASYIWETIQFPGVGMSESEPFTNTPALGGKQQA